MNNVIVKKETRNDRQKKTAEVFTPDTLVNEMLNKLPKEVWKENKTFCDPACGNGAFLVNVLLRKLNNKHNPLEALQSIYGADIMKDNIKECRYRMLKIISKYELITIKHIRVVTTNIVWLNTKYYKKGSLDYDFEFNRKTNNRKITDDIL
jgi:type I restriction-modification system DNA methylase subunit